MNTLSWTIYLIRILAGVKVVLGLLVMVTGLGMVVSFVVGGLAMADNEPETSSSLIKWAWRFMGLFFPVVFLFIIIPNQRTAILIAASEVGEKVALSEQVKPSIDEAGGLAKDSLSLLRSYIERETRAIRKELSEEAK
jgi:hypothetical protein